MVVDYYKLLQVQRNAKDNDLKKAAEAKIKNISEAYDVLSDPRKRALYDQKLKVEEGLWRGFPPPPDSPWSGGQNGSSPDNVFDFSEFFGSGACGSRRMYGDDKFYSGVMEGCVNVGVGRKSKAAAIERTLACTLEDLYMGTTKKLKISRDVVGASGRRSTVEEVLTIEVKPGWKKGTKITFPEKGNDTQKGVMPADIIFIIDEKPHSLFKRDGDDLIVTQKMSLAEALTGHTELTTLDGRNLRVSIDSITGLTHEEVVKGEGMPIQKEQSKKGNLIIKFNIKFPKLTSEQKTGIKQLLTSS